MKTFSITDIIKKAWDTFTADPLVWLIASGILFFAQKLPVFLSEKRLEVNPLYTLIVVVVSVFLAVSMIHMATKSLAGQKLVQNDLLLAKESIFRYLLVAVCVGVLVVLGFALLIVPGLILMCRFFFAQIVTVRERVGLKESLQASTDLTDGVRWQILGFIFVLGLFNIAGALAYGLGMLITIPLTAIAHVALYEHLHAQLALSKVAQKNDPTFNPGVSS